MSTLEIKHYKCPSCKSWRIFESFLSGTCRRLKTCHKCRKKLMIDYKQLAEDRLIDIELYQRDIEMLNDEIADLKAHITEHFADG